jgi:DNA-3-methyladenine glycosylase II
MMSNQHVLHHFRRTDGVIYRAMKKTGGLTPIVPVPPHRYFAALCDTIIGQQLSAKAADTIIERFHALFPSLAVSPEQIIAISPDTLRKIGMSYAKASYVKNLAQEIRNGNITCSSFHAKSDSEIISHLTKVKGVGPWTAEMFLIFTMGREDVFSFGDLGLRKGIRMLYGFDNELSTLQIEKIIAPWTPFKSYASRTLWASMEANPPLT